MVFIDFTVRTDGIPCSSISWALSKSARSFRRQSILRYADRLAALHGKLAGGAGPAGCPVIVLHDGISFLAERKLDGFKPSSLPETRELFAFALTV